MSEPRRIENVNQLEDALSAPTPAISELAGRLDGDLIVLGVAGKMGPTLARMARRAMDEAGAKGRVIGVSRFSQPSDRQKLADWNIETIAGDLLDPAFVASLPKAKHVVFMAGMKFGATGNESLTWAMNTLLPANVCQHYKDSHIAAFSTGNVYGMSPIALGGSVETDAPDPQGEYAMSCLGRERTFEHYSRSQGTKVSLLRLNYACELRYGVLVDLAQKICQGQPIDVSMGVANVIWQRDANAYALASLAHADSPAFALNIAGPEQLSVRRVCQQLADRMGKEVTFTGEEANEAILSNGQKGHRLFGYPTTTINELIDHVACWVKQGGELLGKPTKFEVRDGKF
ncbi:NAD-dependent epimerase/dehydratase family protein [Phycisphaerales bacterium AB-hyl4]|uniref:NAD-dependent epimerase/dehydratase family protein n=1 Tax=Natronomicrosphaera hydrolytica TaxID=3242702 RepID=A0ABV4U4N5_9BACT